MHAIKKSVFVLVALSLVAVTSQVNAKPAKAKKALTVEVITGVVTPAMDKKGKVKHASITGEDGKVYHLVMNKTAKKMVATQADVSTEVSGTVKMKKNKKAKTTEAWLTVKSFKVATTDEPDEPDEAIEEGEGEEVYED